MHDMTDDERSELSTEREAFVDSIESMGNGYVIEMYGRNGVGRRVPSVRVEDQDELMNVLADLADDGVDIRDVSFDGCGRGYLIYHK